MSEEQSTPQTEKSQLNDQPPFTNWVIPEGGAPEVYADWHYVNWLPLTIRIRFGQVVADPRVAPGAKDSSWMIAERMALTMPWHAAKGLAGMLTNLVNQYEKENGELIIPNIPTME